MKCPRCQGRSRVTSVKKVALGLVQRYRKCRDCHMSYKTWEEVQRTGGENGIPRADG